jgi:hypothetical protein
MFTTPVMMVFTPLLSFLMMSATSCALFGADNENVMQALIANMEHLMLRYRTIFFTCIDANASVGFPLSVLIIFIRILEPNIGLADDVCNFVAFAVTNDVCADKENIIQVLIADMENLMEAPISNDF